jgi:hypothetical protein
MGMLVAMVLALAFRGSQNTAIYRFFTTIDRLAFLAASAATVEAFPGDTVQQGISIGTFFDGVLVIATGIQCGFLGLVVGLLIRRKDPVPTV